MPNLNAFRVLLASHTHEWRGWGGKDGKWRTLLHPQGLSVAWPYNGTSEAKKFGNLEILMWNLLLFKWWQLIQFLKNKTLCRSNITTHLLTKFDSGLPMCNSVLYKSAQKQDMGNLSHSKAMFPRGLNAKISLAGVTRTPNPLSQHLPPASLSIPVQTLTNF